MTKVGEFMIEIVTNGDRQIRRVRTQHPIRRGSSDGQKYLNWLNQLLDENKRSKDVIADQHELLDLYRGKMLSFQEKNFDKLTADTTGISKGELDDMSIERRRVIIGAHDNGEPIFKHLQANSVDAMNDKIVQSYIDSGRIWEFIDREEKLKVKTKTLFKPYAESWMQTFKQPKLKPKTYQTYVGYLHTHLYPVFGERFVEEISTQDIQKFMNERADLARKSIKNYVGLLEQIFDAAVEDKLIEENPAKSKRLANPSEKETEREAIPETQFRDIMKNLFRMDDGAEKLMLALFIFTGMRRGEVLGLKWDDIDFGEKCIRIRRNVTHPGNPPVIGTPKTKSGLRDVYFGENLEAILLAVKGKGFIFGGEQPLSRKGFLTLMKRIEKKINLYGATPHVLRHTYLTTAAGENIDPKTLQSMAGHADHQITMNTYVHKKNENVIKAGQMMDALLGSYAKAV